MEKQPDLPTMEGHDSIPELDDLGEEYADIRDKRMELLKKEVDLKAKLLETMKKHNFRSYSHDNIEITVKSEAEVVKVKLKKPKKD